MVMPKKTEMDYGRIVRKFYCSSTLLYRTIQKMTARCILTVIVSAPPKQYSSKVEKTTKLAYFCQLIYHLMDNSNKLPENNYQKYLGVTADVISLATFVLSLLSIALPKNILLERFVAGRLSTFRFFLTTVILFSTAYAFSRLFSYLTKKFYAADKTLRIIFYGFISSGMAWINVFILDAFLYGGVSELHFFFKLGFLIVLGLVCWLDLYLLRLNLNYEEDQEFDDTFVGIFIIIHVIFCFVPVFTF